jgi:hypothetical protein
MNLILILIGSILLVGGLGLGFTSGKISTLLPQKNNELSRIFMSPTPDIKPSSTLSPTPIKSLKDNRTAYLIPVQNPSPSQKTSNENDLVYWIYPGSTEVDSGINTINLSSNDNTDVITGWYEDRIKNLGMNIRTFIKSRANDDVNNKLSASGGKQNISVSVTRKSGDSRVSIKVEI